MSQAELKATLHARIETMDENHLALVHRVLLALARATVRNPRGASFDCVVIVWIFTGEKVQAAISLARAAHPYR